MVCYSTRMQEKNHYDCLIIGGGIVGTTCALEASLRGLSVCLIEKKDLASGTSSASSKLIHGGLRYLEQADFSLVKKALKAREEWLVRAPYLVQPLSFVLPQTTIGRHRWLVRFGLVLYDTLAASNTLNRSHTLKKNDPALEPLQPSIQHAYRYTDCITNDARLTIMTALGAFESGASILTHTEFLAFKRTENGFISETTNGDIQSSAIIDARGPWLPSQSLSLVKGSHIIVPRIFSGEDAYILQHTDKRIIFVIPYENHYSLIGTTEVDVTSPDDLSITQDEIQYLCEITSTYFKKSITPAHVIHAFAGCRPLLAHSSQPARARSRDFNIELSTENTPYPYATLMGGKITTALSQARETIDKLSPYFSNISTLDTSTLTLPGREKTSTSLNYAWCDPAVLKHLQNTYGDRHHHILKACQCMENLGERFGDQLTAREVDYLCSHEWATCADDILWRRTQLGLDFTTAQRIQLNNYLDSRLRLRK